jgi:hypothetical protein
MAFPDEDRAVLTPATGRHLGTRAALYGPTYAWLVDDSLGVMLERDLFGVSRIATLQNYQAVKSDGLSVSERIR